MITNGFLWACPHSFRGCMFPGLHAPGYNPCLADTEGWVHYRKVEALMKPRMSRPTGDAKVTPALERWQDSDFEKDWPYLSAFLKDETWDDGSPRETGTLLLFVQHGCLKCCLNDRGANRSAFLTGVTLDVLFALAEEGLMHGNLDWRMKRA